MYPSIQLHVVIMWLDAGFKEVAQRHTRIAYYSSQDAALKKPTLIMSIMPAAQDCPEICYGTVPSKQHKHALEGANMRIGSTIDLPAEHVPK